MTLVVAYVVLVMAVTGLPFAHWTQLPPWKGRLMADEQIPLDLDDYDWDEDDDDQPTRPPDLWGQRLPAGVQIDDIPLTGRYL